jgi:hypothetical protein
MALPSTLRAPTLALAAIAAAGLASPALAGSEPSTRVVQCRSGSCLQVSGHRDDAAASVSLNGHAVVVEGARNWRVLVPVQTVREWSEPRARTITVAVADTPARTEAEADLPIGLLGHSENLAVLYISTK